MTPAPSRPRIFPRWMVATAAIFAIGWLLYLLRGALTPVFFAFLIAYMLDPVVDRFEARGYSRAVGIAVMLTVVLGGLTVFLALALPGVIRDLVTFFSDLPAKGRELATLAEPLLQGLGVPMPTSLDDVLGQLNVDASELAKQVAVPAGTVLKALLGGTLSLLGAVAGLLLVPVFAAYLLYDFDRITAGIRDLVPLRYRTLVVDVARDVDGILGEFIRGQLIVMLILAVLYGVAYSLIGVHLGVLIGVVAGLLSFIPYVGGGVAVGLGVAMSLIYWTGWGQLAGVVVAYSIIQVIEGFVITPRIVGDKVGLSAVWVLFALLVGGEVFGFMGVLLALPAAAVIKIFVVRGLTWYRASELFLGDAPAEVTPVEPEAPPPEAEAPPPEAQTPPPEAQTPPPEAQTPPPEAEAPPPESEAPPPESEAPPPEPQVPLEPQVPPESEAPPPEPQVPPES